MGIFCPGGSRMMRGPHRKSLTIHGGRNGMLSHYFDLTIGVCNVPAITLNATVFNSLASGAWEWQSYDRICKAFNQVAVSGGGLTPSGLGPGTTVMPLPNTAPIVCTAFLVDSPV